MRLLPFAIYLATASGFLPSAFLRRNAIHPLSSHNGRPRPSSTAHPCSLPKPVKPAGGETTSLRMLSDDSTGEQREGEQQRAQRQEEGTPAAAATTTPASTTITDNGTGSDEALLPTTVGSGRYLVQSVLGIGSTASTYRCTTAATPNSSTQPSTPSEGRPQGQGQPERYPQRVGSTVGRG